ncbi:IS110 family transposase [Acidocella sp.]|uniref:IS110 family transposase n=1 Tax=Acidocella sp. TaxID=50710 RepID=UPI00260ECF96|nr:IS110 family transposase [Acidocella sp.]
MNITTYAVDLAKDVFQVHGYDRQGQRVWVRRLNRTKFQRFCAELTPGVRVVMEATRSAHHWGRLLQGRDVRVELLPPQHVKALLMGNKTDANDADAIYEASLRPKLRRVPVKTCAQQALLTEHRVREARIKTRTQTINQIRGLLAEFGVVLGARGAPLRRALPAVLEDAENTLPDAVRLLLAEALEDLLHLDARIEASERRLFEVARSTPACRRLLAVEGLGPITATALVASVGEGRGFERARPFASSLGLVPREYSSGHRRQLGPITKRGNPYLRKLLIHGARAVVRAAGPKTDARSRWIQTLQARRGLHKTVVALANKNARIVWALLRSGHDYRQPQAA